MRVQLFLSTPVLGVAADGVAVEGGRIRARTVIWTTGNRAPEWLAEAGLQVDRAGRARVDSHLAAIGHPEIAVLGDAALAHDPSGLEVPASAQMAVQQADYLANRLRALTRAGDQRSFVSRSLGEALSLGPDRGLARVGGLPLVNGPALLVKRLAHVRYLHDLGGPRLDLEQLTREYCSVHAGAHLVRSPGPAQVGSGHVAH
jgi:NADH dehydrogenase